MKRITTAILLFASAVMAEAHGCFTPTSTTDRLPRVTANGFRTSTSCLQNFALTLMAR